MLESWFKGGNLTTDRLNPWSKATAPTAGSRIEAFDS